MCASGQSSRHTNIVQHRIIIGDAQPIRQAPRKLPLAKQEEAKHCNQEGQLPQKGPLTSWYSSRR